jgi:hypothetical protein
MLLWTALQHVFAVQSGKCGARGPDSGLHCGSLKRQGSVQYEESTKTPA